MDSVYRFTDSKMLFDQNPGLMSKYRAILGWDGSGDKGLLVYGGPGLGKTRMVWKMVLGLFESGVSVKAFDSTGFADGVSTEFGAFNGPDWVQSLVIPDIVFFDDIDKMVATPRVQSALFSVVEKRTSVGKKIVVTTNLFGTQFESRFDPLGNGDNSIGTALGRRLREFCEPVSFGVRAPR